MPTLESESEEMARLRQIRDDYAKSAEKAQRDVDRAQARLESARTKLSIADEMLDSIRKPKPVGATFIGMGKYADSTIIDAVLDVINANAGINGMSVNDIREILINEGVEPKQHLNVTIHVVAQRLSEKRKAIRIEQTDDGKRFFKLMKPEEPQVAA